MLKSFPPKGIKACFILVVALTCNAHAQHIGFKKNLEARKSFKELKFQTESFRGTLSATINSIELKVLNQSGQLMTSESLNLSITDISGRGFDLCTPEIVVLEHKQKQSFSFRNCSDDKGVFFLKNDYINKEEFRSSNLYLQDKEWILHIGNESFRFYTNI